MLMTGLAACPCAARGGVRDRSTLTLEPASAKHVPVPVVVWQEPFTVEARISGIPYILCIDLALAEGADPSPPAVERPAATRGP